MGTYKHTVAKPQAGGFSESPVQTEGNSSSSLLDDKTKKLVGYGVAYSYGRKAFGTVIKAQVSTMGIAEIERSLESVQKLSHYVLIASISPPLAGFAIVSDMFASSIERAVNIHNTNLDNERTIEERGTRRDMNAGGYYG